MIVLLLLFFYRVGRNIEYIPKGVEGKGGKGGKSCPK